MISKAEVKHIAKLARLGLTPKEVEKYQKELSLILDYVRKLKKIDAELSQIAPASRFFEVKNVMREDEIKSMPRTESEVLVQGQKLMELAPETKRGYLKVKKII